MNRIQLFGGMFDGMLVDNLNDEPPPSIRMIVPSSVNDYKNAFYCRTDETDNDGRACYIFLGYD